MGETKKVYCRGYVKAQFVEKECVHLSIAIGRREKITIQQACRAIDRPTEYNATRELGIHLADALQGTIKDNLGVDLSDIICLSRLIPGIPQGGPREDAGLHMSLYNKSPSGLAPSKEAVDIVLDMFKDGVALQLDLSDLKIVKGLRCNDMSTGGMYYFACGMSSELKNLCNLIKERFSDYIKGYAPHVSLELWGVRGCRHPQQKIGNGLDLQYQFCDYLRWGMEPGTFTKCLDKEGKFDLARYMYVRTHEVQDFLTPDDRTKADETLSELNNFSMNEIDGFIMDVDRYTGFGAIPMWQRFHKEGSPGYNFFNNAPHHPGVDCLQSKIKNCAVACGRGPCWYPSTEFVLPRHAVQVKVEQYIKKLKDTPSCGCLSRPTRRNKHGCTTQ